MTEINNTQNKTFADWTSSWRKLQANTVSNDKATYFEVTSLFITAKQKDTLG
jgi:hypothetical protein